MDGWMMMMIFMIIRTMIIKIEEINYGDDDDDFDDGCVNGRDEHSDENNDQATSNKSSDK